MALVVLQQRPDQRAVELDALVNNAGFGLHGSFIGQNSERLHAMLQLNIISLTELTHSFGRRTALAGSRFSQPCT